MKPPPGDSQIPEARRVGAPRLAFPAVARYAGHHARSLKTGCSVNTAVLTKKKPRRRGRVYLAAYSGVS